MCTWRRLARLERTLELLAAQTVPVELYVWNNNWREQARVNEAARTAPIPTHVVHSRRNIGGFGRFYLARELASAAGQVVFIDDDQEFSPVVIERLRSTTAHERLAAGGHGASSIRTNMHRASAPLPASAPTTSARAA